MSDYAIAGSVQQLGRRPGPVDAKVETLKGQYDWFVVAPTQDGQDRIGTKEDFQELLRGDILACRLRANSAVRVYSKKGAAWEESTPLLRVFAREHSKLQALYEPLWARAVTGRDWGMLVGMGLAILNAIGIYSRLNRLVAIGLAVSVLASFVPGFVRKMTPYLFSVPLVMGGTGVAIGILGAVTLLAGLGAVTGMAIGGAIGWTWEDKLPRAPDAPEAAHGAIQSVVLPLIGALLLWSAYLFVLYPWAVHTVGSPLTHWRTLSQP